jgi:hypothetical protein
MAGVRHSALPEVGHDPLAEVAQEQHVSLAELRPLLMGQTAEHISRASSPVRGTPM